MAKKAQRKTPKRTKPKAVRARSKSSNKATPKFQPLPGMEDMRHPVLGPCCERIADARERATGAASDEAGEKQVALQTMRKENRQSFQAHGIELVRVPGEEALRVKRSKTDKATAVNLGGAIDSIFGDDPDPED
jgi:hypothetical protein